MRAYPPLSSIFLAPAAVLSSNPPLFSSAFGHLSPPVLYPLTLLPSLLSSSPLKRTGEEARGQDRQEGKRIEGKRLELAPGG
jgi:hypothetical protein